MKLPNKFKTIFNLFCQGKTGADLQAGAIILFGSPRCKTEPNKITMSSCHPPGFGFFSDERTKNPEG